MRRVRGACSRASHLGCGFACEAEGIWRGAILEGQNGII